MRECIRCKADMIENLDIRDSFSGSELKVTRPDTQGTMPKNNFGSIKVAVCPKCDYIETYLSRLDKIQKEIK